MYFSKVIRFFKIPLQVLQLYVLILPLFCLQLFALTSTLSWPTKMCCIILSTFSFVNIIVKYDAEMPGIQLLYNLTIYYLILTFLWMLTMVHPKESYKISQNSNILTLMCHWQQLLMTHNQLLLLQIPSSLPFTKCL